MMNPCLNNMGSKECAYIMGIISESRRWECIPDCREPLAKEIVEYIIDKGKQLSKSNSDNIYSALGDWLILGLQGGFRRKAWVQDRAYLKKNKYVQCNSDGTPASFLLRYY